MRIEPPPSFAWASGTMPAATDAAEPPLEPPVEWSRFQGLWQAPYSTPSVVGSRPNSGTLVLPIATRPAALKRVTRVSSCTTGRSFKKRAPELVGTPA